MFKLRARVTVLAVLLGIFVPGIAGAGQAIEMRLTEGGGSRSIRLSAEELLLSNSSVLVRVSYRNQYSGERGEAKAVPQNDEFGFFYFSDPNNPEVFVKVLDFGSTSPFLLFYTGLTDFEYTVSFTNVKTGKVVSYVKPAGSFEGGGSNSDLPHASFRTILWSRDGETAEDVTERPPAGRGLGTSLGSWERASRAKRQPGPLAGTELLLSHGTVAVTVVWRSQYSGESGNAFALPQKDEYGYFYFSDPNNTEVVVKVLDFGSSSPYLVFHAGLTDFEYEVTFRNVQSNQSVTFKKPAGSFMGGANNTTLVHGAWPDEITIMLPGNVPLVLVRIPAGTFEMGSPMTEMRRNPDETLHQVTLTSDYYMGKYEMTQRQWRAAMGWAMPGSCGYYGAGDDYPVYCVSWDEIAATGGFFDKLNGLQATTLKFRLPTEAEWERSARAGTQTRYSFGDVEDCDDQCGQCPVADPYVWWCANAGNSVHPVGQKKASAYGLHDMHGNVWEWNQDWYDLYPSEAVTDPRGPATGSFKVMRGGDAFYLLGNTRSAFRNGTGPTSRGLKMGFRVVATP